MNSKLGWRSQLQASLSVTNSKMEADEDIDNDTLQAKVDASLAYVNDMVSSWMKPSKTPSSSRKDVEKEIEELMRRPPRLVAPFLAMCCDNLIATCRLGVGAKPPESNDLSGREALRLKGRLVGKKRERGEEAVNNKALSDDEGESRAGAIKKKPKLDSSDGMGKKKKQKTLVSSEAGPSATSLVQEPAVKTR